jgi:hypothetical protein
LRALPANFLRNHPIFELFTGSSRVRGKNLTGQASCLTTLSAGTADLFVVPAKFRQWGDKAEVSFMSGKVIPSMPGKQNCLAFGI